MVAERVTRFPPTIFSEFSALAARCGAVNLGQGFPDFDGPDEVKSAAIAAIEGGLNQYATSHGARELREAIAGHALRFWGMPVDPESMVMVTSGATEALFDTAMALLDPGDEAVVFEPHFDVYVPAVQMAGGVPRFVPLRPPDPEHSSWWFLPEELEAAFGPSTRLLFLNTPHNPTGKVFSRPELELIAELCIRHDVIVLSDEVYEHIVFEPARHLPIATLPGMAGRTVTVSSGGKTFSFTGWKIGWAIAAQPLRDALQQAHQFVTFASAAPLQQGIAAGLRLPDSYFHGLAADYRTRRNRLASALEVAGLRPILPEGAYYVMADLAASGFSDDYAFCRFLTQDLGVAAIPASALCSSPAQARPMARFAFCKSDGVLAAAAERLAKLKARLPRR